jgi:hypothetical protein
VLGLDGSYVYFRWLRNPPSKTRGALGEVHDDAG